MIRRLQRKFVLINMALVATVLIIVVSVAWVMTYRQERGIGEAALHIAVSREHGMPPARFQIDPQKPPMRGGDVQIPMQPVFTVTLDAQGGIVAQDTDSVDVSDETLQQAASQALAADAKEGVLKDLNLRYAKELTPMGGTRIAFLDRSVEQSAIARQMMMLALVCLGALAAFFVISIFLARWALRPVEKAWRQQKQFVADASHELKTPLTVVLANLDILQDNGEETVASQQKWIENTRVEAVRMRKLVDGMLFLAKSDATELARQSAEFSLTDTVWSCVLSLEPVAYEQHIELASDLDDGLRINGDEGQIAQLVTILLDNACKYTQAGGAITVRLKRQQDKACIAVHNSGVTIDPQDIPHLFERFYRADKARVHAKGGYGLGLSIAEQIVRQHGGRISVDSGADTGTTFTVQLPLK